MDLHARYPNSQGYLRIALLELLRKKNFDEITTTAIAKKAGYIRQTFYLYYQSKEAILQEIVRDLASGLLALMEQAYSEGYEALLCKLTENYHPLFIEYFCYMRKYGDEFGILLNPFNGTKFYDRFSKEMDSFQQKYMKGWSEIDGVYTGNTVQKFYSTAGESFITGLLRWITNGMTPDETTMAIYHTQLWTSYIFLLKDTDSHYIYEKFIVIMKNKGLLYPGRQ